MPPWSRAWEILALRNALAQCGPAEAAGKAGVPLADIEEWLQFPGSVNLSCGQLTVINRALGYPVGGPPPRM